MGFPKNFGYNHHNVKKVDQCDIKNYRGIAILSAIPKLFEKLVFNMLAPLFPSLIQTDQHGFMKGR
jgi:hypothetical protein